MSEREDAKAQLECEVFRKFATVAALALDVGSVESRRPPEPDIRCSVGGNPRLIELVEITDPDLAARCAKARRERRPTGGFFSDDRPLACAVASKAEKTYETGGVPVFLLAYYDKQYPTSEVDPEIIRRTIHGIAQGMVTFEGWSGMWVFDTWTNRILWRYPNNVADAWVGDHA